MQNILERALTLCEGQEILPEHLQLPEQSATQPNLPSFTTTTGNDSLEDYLVTIEKNLIVKALDDTRWNRTAAAKKLGMSFRSLRYRLKKLGLDDESSDDESDDQST